MTPRFNVETQFGKKPPIVTSCTIFHSFEVNLVRSQTLLKVTKHTIRCDPIKGFDHPIRSGLVRGL